MEWEKRRWRPGRDLAHEKKIGVGPPIA